MTTVGRFLGTGQGWGAVGVAQRLGSANCFSDSQDPRPAPHVGLLSPSPLLPRPSFLSLLPLSLPGHQCEVWRIFIVWLLHTVLPKSRSFGLPLLAGRFMTPRSSPGHSGAGLVPLPHPVFVLAGSPMPLTSGKGSGVFLICHNSCPPVNHQVPGSVSEPQPPGQGHKNALIPGSVLRLRRRQEAEGPAGITCTQRGCVGLQHHWCGCHSVCPLRSRTGGAHSIIQCVSALPTLAQDLAAVPGWRSRRLSALGKVPKGTGTRMSDARLHHLPCSPRGAGSEHPGGPCSDGGVLAPAVTKSLSGPQRPQ